MPIDRISPGLIPALCLAALAAGPAIAQDAGEEVAEPAFPETEIFLFDYDATRTSDALSNGRNVTNRPGYDNQPRFTPNGATFLYSRDDGTQTDIWEYDLESGAHTRITDTPESEFSPTPSADGQTISMVFERNNSIWQLDRSAPDQPRWVLEASGVAEPVGYFARNEATGDVFYWSRYGYNVALSSDRERAYHFITGHAVPATPRLIPGTGRFSFVHRQTNEEVWIKEFDPATRAVRPIAPLAGTNPDHVWAPNGAILRVDGGKLYRWPVGGEGWDAVADLSDYGVANANRLAISPDGRQLAVVGQAAEASE